MKKIIVVLLAATFVLCMGNFSSVFAQEREVPRRGMLQKRAILFELLSEKDKEELIALRQECMEKFRSVARKKLEAKKDELSKLERENPEEFKRVINQAREKTKQRITQLREKNPQKFEEMKKRRIIRIKRELRYIKEADPTQYEEIIKGTDQVKGPTSPSAPQRSPHNEPEDIFGGDIHEGY